MKLKHSASNHEQKDNKKATEDASTIDFDWNGNQKGHLYRNQNTKRPLILLGFLNARHIWCVCVFSLSFQFNSALDWKMHIFIFGTKFYIFNSIYSHSNHVRSISNHDFCAEDWFPFDLFWLSYNVNWLSVYFSSEYSSSSQFFTRWINVA